MKLDPSVVNVPNATISFDFVICIKKYKGNTNMGIPNLWIMDLNIITYFIFWSTRQTNGIQCY